ncbi:DinB family protein [Pseudonocardia pini]|uniref:DinB family protein n=1 Tax=Pseudonocardia pini TaxID=2758030 RepID=UPI0015F00CEC|nr:DinB family protein [Pseudonocardia pini]
MKDDLVRYLRRGWETLPWKLEGISEYDVRRPLTPTGTSLLGLVKHVALTTAGYFGEVLGRPAALDWRDEEPNADMWARADETRAQVLGWYATAVADAETALAELPLDHPAHVSWWPEPDVTLHRIAVHMTAELHRHCGHADILREQLDGAVGMTPTAGNLPEDLPWETYRARLQAAADTYL